MPGIDECVAASQFKSWLKVGVLEPAIGDDETTWQLRSWLEVDAGVLGTENCVAA